MNKRILVLVFAMLSFTLALPVWSQTAISSGQTIGALSGPRLSARYYRIHVPAGKSRLVFQTWGGSGNADLFVRYRYGLPSTSISTARSTAVGNNATITINNPAAGSWYILVRGTAAYSGVYLRATYSVIAPAIPAGVGATQTMTQQVRVTWGAASRATSYEVWRRASTASTATRIATTASTSFSDTRAAVGVTYYYWVRARNSAGVSRFSARVTGRRVPITLLSNGQSFGTFGGSQGSLRFFKIYVPAVQNRLVVQTGGGSGNADLYLRYGGLPSTSLYNGRSLSGNNTDTITINNPAAGWWYILVRGVSAFTGAYIRATALIGPPPAGMVVIPAGTNSGTDPDIGAYSLTVEAFYMDATEVTKALWDEVRTWAAADGYTDLREGYGKAASHPVNVVSWYDCVKWCNARSQKDSRTPVYYTDAAFTQVYKTGVVLEPYVKSTADGYRLPTVVQWQYAARGGVANRRFPWGDSNNIQHARANYLCDRFSSYDTSSTLGHHPTYATGGAPYTSPVGSFAANGYGLYDMAGNVAEWCYDVFRSSYAYEGIWRRKCGGGWASFAQYCRVGQSGINYPQDRFNSVGFRAVLPPGR